MFFFLKAKDIHDAKSFFPTPFLLLANVHTSLYDLNAILKGLKNVTSKGCNVSLVCDGTVIRSNPTAHALCMMSIVTWELWPLRICKCRLNVHKLP